MTQRYETILQQGATWDRVFQLSDLDGTPIDLTGCQAQMQFRADPDSPVLVTPTLTLGGALGTIRAVIPYTTLVNLDLSMLSTGTIYETFRTPQGLIGYKATGPLVRSDLEVTFSDGVTVIRVVDITACISREITHV